MDAHFNEYLAAVAGMQDLYGELGDEHPSDFHDEHPVAAPAEEHAVFASVLP
jgi:hypothetical protein